MCDVQIFSFSSFGYEGEIIKVEADLKMGLPSSEIVGLPGSAVKEARDRMRVAIRNSGFDFPLMRILINLCPASEKKDGSGFDLPIAVAVLNAKSGDEIEEATECDATHSVLIIGELELSGVVRPVYGVLGAIASGMDSGIRHFIVPLENREEALIPGAVSVYGVRTLSEAMACFAEIKEKFTREDCRLSDVSFQTSQTDICNIADHQISWTEFSSDENQYIGDYDEIRGQKNLLFALKVAAAGGHNLLAYGAPGCGKTLSLTKFQSLLPDLDFQTAQEVTRIYSVAGLLKGVGRKSVLIKRPPFRMPHQNASLEGIIGGAGKCMPGEISLAHGGVLFLDEVSQYKSSVLQSLRAPLETGVVSLSRAERRTTFPARFQLLMAVNPCPCGNLGVENKFCTCAPVSVERYWKKMTAPLLDRIELRIPVEAPKSGILEEKRETTAQMRAEIKKAYEIELNRNAFYMKKRLEKVTVQQCKNANLGPKELSEVCLLTPEARRLFEHNVNNDSLSGRGSHAILKVARTIADFEASEKITMGQLEEAIAMRKWISFLPDFL